jgi:hypothetical protein
MYQKIATKGTDQPMVRRLSDAAVIPFDPNNSDYRVYLEWLDGYEETPNGWVKTSDGNTPLPVDQE